MSTEENQGGGPAPLPPKKGPLAWFRRHTTPWFREQLFIRSHFLFPFLLILVILAAGTYLTYSLWTGPENVEGLPGEAIDPSLPLSNETFVGAYLRAQGGRENLAGLHSIRLEGELLAEGQMRPFVLLKKAPDMARLTLALDEVRVTIALKGEEGWMSVEAPGGGREFSRLSAEEIPEYQGLTEFFDPLASLILEGMRRIRALQRVRENGRILYDVEVERTGSPESLRFRVDAATMQVLSLREDAGGGRERTSEFSAYRAVRGVQIPFETEVRVDGELETRIVLDRVQANVGVMSSIFEMPSPPQGAAP
jgi:hypothetical protein